MNDRSFLHFLAAGLSISNCLAIIKCGQGILLCLSDSLYGDALILEHIDQDGDILKAQRVRDMLFKEISNLKTLASVLGVSTSTVFRGTKVITYIIHFMHPQQR